MDVTSHSVTTDGADIHYTRQGQGPLLILIPGGGGDGARYQGLARALEQDFTILSMDRRCCGQSTGDRSAHFDAAQQAGDVAAIIRAEGGTAHVFGNSGGGVVALKLAEDHPDILDKVVVHEPPCLPVLNDGAHWIAETDKIEATFRTAGPMQAMMQFIGQVEGVNGPPPGPPPNPRDIAFFLDKELHHICRFAPDLDALKASGVALALGAGTASGDAYYVRTARVIAKALNAPYVAFAGHHFAHAADPARYAEDIRTALAAL